jgi:hypothetical protein
VASRGNIFFAFKALRDLILYPYLYPFFYPCLTFRQIQQENKEGASANIPNRENKKESVEMTDSGKPGKPKAGFPPFPKPLEIAHAIPTFPPHDPDYSSQKAKKKDLGGLSQGAD